MELVDRKVDEASRWVYGWVIMFEVNAKNSYGAYVGFRTRYLVLNNGRYNWLNSVTHDDPPMPHFFT